MRRPAIPQDPLRTPLNHIFGSEGNVRVLRVLASAREPIGRTRVARRAQLNASGVRRTLDELAEIGLVEAIGSGRGLSVRLRDRHPLASEIRFLFESERQVFDRLVTSMTEVLDHPGFPGRAVWIESADAREPGTVHVGVLGSPGEVANAAELVRGGLQDVEQRLAMHFVVHTYTGADLVALSDGDAERLREVTLLHGWLPGEWQEAGGGPVRTHRYLDERARRLAHEIARNLPSDPSIVERTLEWLERRIDRSSRREASDLREWRRILDDLSLQQVQSFLREDSERADRLRQSLPFVEVLGPGERREIFEPGSS